MNQPKRGPSSKSLPNSQRGTSSRFRINWTSISIWRATVERRQRAQRLPRASRRQERQILLPVQRPEFQANPPLPVPNRITDYRADAQLLREARAVLEGTLLRGVERLPRADELFDFHRHIEIICQNIAKAGRGARL